MNIKIDSIQNHGTVIQILGTDRDGRTRSVVGDWRMMDSAIEGLGLRPGMLVGVEDTDDGEALVEAFRCEHDTHDVCSFCSAFRSDVPDILEDR